MSHPTTTASAPTAGELHRFARAAWHEARATQADGRYATATSWWETTAEAYIELADATIRPYRAAAWLALADEATTHSQTARNAAHHIADAAHGIDGNATGAWLCSGGLGDPAHLDNGSDEVAN